MKLAPITLSAIVGICIVCVLGVFSSRNGAISLEESVKTAQSGIDVMLSNRFNKLHELASCVKQYDAHEYKALVDVINARGKNMTGSEAKQCIAAFSRVEERYPELKSQKNYGMLMTEISLIENQVAQSKNAYNEFVRDYNRYCRKFPTYIFLGFTGYEVVKFEYYKAEAETKDTKPLNLF